MSATDHTVPPELTVMVQATATLRAIGALLDEAGIPDGDLLARVQALRNPLAGIGSRLLFSQRAALDRAGAPTAGEDGCPVSDGWRAKWAAEEVVRLRARLEEEGRLVVRLMDEADKAAADQTILRNERERALRRAADTAQDLYRLLALIRGVVAFPDVEQAPDPEILSPDVKRAAEALVKFVTEQRLALAAE